MPEETKPEELKVEVKEPENKQEEKVEEEKEEKKSKKEIEKEEMTKLKQNQEKLNIESMNVDNTIDLVSEAYYEMDKKISKIVNGISHALIIEGDGGIGKTTKVMQALMREVRKNGGDPEKEIAFTTGHQTPQEFYCWCFEHRHDPEDNLNFKYVVIDDGEGLFSKEINLSTLKGLTWKTPSGKRIASFNTSKPLQGEHGYVELSFETSCAYIIISNKIKENNTLKEHIKAVKDRMDYCKVNLNREQLLLVLEQISKIPDDEPDPRKKLTPEEKMEVFDYLKIHTNDGTVDYSIRTILAMQDNYRLSKIDETADWKKLSDKMLDRIDVGKLITALHDQHMKDAEILQEVKEKTGISKSKYYRIKEDLGLSTRNGIKAKPKNKSKKTESIPTTEKEPEETEAEAEDDNEPEEDEPTE